jgi:hypothetical protein
MEADAHLAVEDHEVGQEMAESESKSGIRRASFPATKLLGATRPNIVSKKDGVGLAGLEWRSIRALRRGSSEHLPGILPRPNHPPLAAPTLDVGTVSPPELE